MAEQTNPSLDTARLMPHVRDRSRLVTLKACIGCGRRSATARCPDCAEARPAPVYDYAHQRRRAALLPHAIGRPCPYCHQTMRPDQPLDLDHTVDGITHATCNRREGAAITNGTRAA